jgi:anti-sigma factor RsiW
MYVRYVASHPALPAERRMRTHHTAQPPRTATPPGRKAKDMNVKLDSAAATSATNTVTIGRTRPAPLRITKRGRAVVTMLAAIPLVAGALVFAVNGGMATATQTGSSATFEHVTVASGQSLWQLAAALAPSADPREVVSDIVHLNQLDGADVQPGQRLALPVQYSH